MVQAAQQIADAKLGRTQYPAPLALAGAVLAAVAAVAAAWRWRTTRLPADERFALRDEWRIVRRRVLAWSALLAGGLLVVLGSAGAVLDDAGAMLPAAGAIPELAR